MRDEFYIQEAFSKLKLLDEEVFDLSKDVGVADELTSFVADDIDYDEEPIIDTEANTESELKDNYLGKVILECNCCHTRLYKEEADVVIDEETGTANEDEPCPVCNGEYGYTVIGKIEPFDADADPAKEDEPVEVDLEDEEEAEGEEVEDEEDEKVESYRNLIKGKDFLNESKDEMNKDDVCPECGKNPCICEKCDEDLSESFADELPATLSMVNDYIDEIKSVDESLNESGFIGGIFKIAKITKILSWLDTHKYVAGTLSKEDDEICLKYLENVKSLMSGSDDPKENGEIIAKNLDELYFYLNKVYKIMNRAMRSDESLESNSSKNLNEEELAHGNDQIGVRDDTSVDDDKSLEDDQTELYKAAFEKRDAINESKPTKASLGESIEALKNKITSLREALEDVVVNTDEGSVEVSKEGSKVIVDFSGGEGDMPEVDPMAGEMIAPLGDEDMADIEDNVPEDEMGDEMPMDDMGMEEPIEGGEELGGEEELGFEGEEELPAEEEEEGPPMESLETNKGNKLFLEGFDNKGFEKMADVFMHRIYENVNNYKVSRVGQDDSNGNIVVEGVINFNSGKTMPTTFTFDSITATKSGKTVLEGINNTFSKAKAFRVRGTTVDRQYIPESLTYDYSTRTINESNESETIRVKGRVKR